jgi:hypothetical protein
MRLAVTLAAIAALAATTVRADDAGAPAQGAPTDEAIINMCGGRLVKMFAQFGTPANVWAMRGSTPAEDDVFCHFGSFGFRVRNKTINTCFFFSRWKGPIRGIKMGDSRDDVVKVLGKPSITVKDKNGVVTAYGYKLKDIDADFLADFDENGKVTKAEVSLD